MSIKRVHRIMMNNFRKSYRFFIMGFFSFYKFFFSFFHNYSQNPWWREMKRGFSSLECLSWIVLQIWWDFLGYTIMQIALVWKVAATVEDTCRPCRSIRSLTACHLRYVFRLEAQSDRPLDQNPARGIRGKCLSEDFHPILTKVILARDEEMITRFIDLFSFRFS